MNDYSHMVGKGLNIQALPDEVCYSKKISLH